MRVEVKIGVRMPDRQQNKGIAILIPSYNSVDTIPATLRSILALREDLRTHIDFVMLSDDGSTDKTIALANSMWDEIQVPLVIRSVDINGGEYRNVNGAIAAMPSHIEWVIIMHADNEALPTWISILARECYRATHDVATICGSYDYVSDGVVIEIGDQRGPDFIEDVRGGIASVRDTLRAGCWWHNGACVVRVSAWIAVGGHPVETPLLTAAQMLGFDSRSIGSRPKIRIKGDWDTCLRFLSSGYTIRYVGTALIRYVEYHASVSSGAFFWHGDLLETLQVIRRHQSALGLSDLIRLHYRVAFTLTKRMGGAILRRQWQRFGLALSASPTLAASFLCSLINHWNRGGETKSIPFRQ